MSLQTRLGLKTEPLFLIDGHAFIYRGFYAYPDFKRSDGFPTSAMYIIFKLVLKLLREEKPSHLVFITDGRGPTFRNELLSTYKANRPRMPEGLAAQLEPLKAGLRLLGVPVLEAEGCEADDCIASLAARFKAGRSVVIVGADKDLRQCLDDNVVMWDPAQGKEKIVTLEGFVEETGLHFLICDIVRVLSGMKCCIPHVGDVVATPGSEFSVKALVIEQRCAKFFCFFLGYLVRIIGNAGLAQIVWHGSQCSFADAFQGIGHFAHDHFKIGYFAFIQFNAKAKVGVPGIIINST